MLYSCNYYGFYLYTFVFWTSFLALWRNVKINDWLIDWHRIARMGMLLILYVCVYMMFAANTILNLLSLCTYRWWHWVLTGQDLLRGGQGCGRGKQSVLLLTTGHGFPPKGHREHGAIFPLGIRRIHRLASSFQLWLVCARQPGVAKEHSALRFTEGGVQRSFVWQHCQRYQLLHQETGKRVERYASCRWSSWEGKSQTHTPKSEQVGTLPPSRGTYDQGSNQRTSAVWRQFKLHSLGKVRCLETLIKSYWFSRSYKRPVVLPFTLILCGCKVLGAFILANWRYFVLLFHIYRRFSESTQHW